MDGLTSFIMKKQKAKYVMATDLAPRENFLASKEYLDLDIDYQPEKSLSDLASELDVPLFDVMVFAGVLYHQIDPFQALLQCRKLIKNEGILILKRNMTQQHHRRS